MNKLDLDYQNLLQDILENGVVKKDRTGTGTISVFGRQIRHKMSEGFPLLTTKKMAFKGIATELIWFLKGDTNIKYLVENGCYIWNGDAYKNYLKNFIPPICPPTLDVQPSFYEPMSYVMFTESIKEKNSRGDEFAKKWGDLGPIYGKQWRQWQGWMQYEKEDKTTGFGSLWYDQIAMLIHDLKTNPDSRRLMVNAWNVAEIDKMVLPPCHYGFQCYTRELTLDERCDEYIKRNPKETNSEVLNYKWIGDNLCTHEDYNKWNIPTRAISLMWNQRSVDTFLGLPFNIASYGLLLEIIAKAVNMVPDELIGNLGDVHLYSNHIEQAKEQIGRERTHEEMVEIYHGLENKKDREGLWTWSTRFEVNNIKKKTREPYPLPKLNINTEFWPTEGGECGVGPLDALAIFDSFDDDNFCKCLLEEDIQLSNYVFHPKIEAPLSN